jgi:hypothetical protein
MEDGHWKQKQEFSTDRCALPTTRKLPAKLRAAEAFLHHHYPNVLLQNNSLTSSSAGVSIKQPNGLLTPLPTPRKMIYRKFSLLNSHERATVGEGYQWQMGKHNWRGQFITTLS